MTEPTEAQLGPGAPTKGQLDALAAELDERGGREDACKRFYLYRHQDLNGISGTGIVADGVQWPDGAVTMRWRGARPSTVNWNSIEDAEAIHGHGGATVIVWIGSDFA